MYTIRHLMMEKTEQGTVTILSQQTVYEALKLMAEKNVGAVIIMDAGEMVGIFTERDYARKIILLGKSSLDVPLSEAMTRAMITITPTNTLEDAMTLMTEHHIRHLPVVDDGKLTGMVSMRDVVEAIISHKNDTIESLEDYIQGKGYPR